MNIRDKFFDDLAKGARWDVGVSIARGNPLPLDANSVFGSYAELETYAAGVLAYPGQVVAVVNADSTVIYYLDQEKAIQPVGVIPAGDEKSIEIDENDVISLHDFGKAYYRYIAEDGDVPAHYERVVVGEPIEEGSEEKYAWKAGLEPKVVTEEGKLVIGWYEPNPTTIEGVNDQVTAVQGTVADLEASVGVPSSEGVEASGLYKEVEDVQAEVEELVDVIGSSEDTLGDDLNTIWAHVNDQKERLKALEDFDHSVYALVSDLEEEVERAGEAEGALSDRIKAVEDDHLVGADKTALEGSINGVADRVAVIEGDYLKAADIENMATDAEVEAAVKAEETRAKGVEESLQTQINTIMNNPDAEGAINSINEFTQYVKDHGEIAEGFRTDINKNKEDIASEIERAEGAEGALSGRLDALEAIDHEAYKTADATLKSELEDEISKKADATALEDAVEELENANSALDGRLVAVEGALAEEGSVAKAIAAAEERAAADATSKADAAKDAAIADAAAKYATTGALSGLESALDARLDSLEAHDHSTYATKTELTVVETTANNANTAVSNLETRFDEIVAVGGEPNAINKIQVNGSELAIENKTVNIAVPTKFSDLTDDSGFSSLISAAKTQADKGVTDAAAADAKAVANAEEIAKHETRLGTLETAKTDHETRILAVENANSEHAGQFSSLKTTVEGHTEAIAKKADASALDTAVGRIAANETAIKTLNETTVPAINAEIAKKANASALDNYYTKEQVGALDKTVVELIADAKSEATYDDTAVKALITAEETRAKAAEKANADEIARVDAALKAAVENDGEGLDSIKELASWIEEHGTDAGEMAKGIEDNAAAIAAINHEETGILAQAKAYVDALPAATAEALGLVKYDDVSIKMNESQQLYVAKVSTDILEQGSQALVLNGGSAKE